MSGKVRRIWRLVLLGARAELRNPGLWLPGLLAVLAVGAFALNTRSAGPSAAVVLAARLGQTYGLAACLWFAYRALRDQDERLGAVLRSKPVDGADWVLVTWATGLAVWTALLAATFLAVSAALASGAGLAGVAAGVYAFGLTTLTVLAAGTLSFALSRMLRSPLGGILIVLAWFCVIAGLQYAPPYLRPEYGQNRLLFLGAAAVVLALAALIVERFRRQELRRPLVPVLATLALVPVAVAGAVQAARAAAPLTDPSGTVWEAMGRQHLELGQRIPGFWLPDGKGGLVRTADHLGKVLFVYLFAAEDLESARTLRELSRLQRELGPRGVQVLGVCLSPDHSDGSLLARAGDYGFPIGADQSTLRAMESPQSAVAAAYDVKLLPLLVVTDRRRVAREILADPYYDLSQLRAAAERRLAEEP